jgi:hypothetical protein
MRILLIEFVWQVDKIISEKKIKDFDLIISFNPETSYKLKKNLINFFESDEVINEDHLTNKYEEIANNSINLCSIIDNELQKVDLRFKKLNWKIFNDYHYCLKITYEQLIYYSEVLSVVLKKYQPKEIVLSAGSSIKFNEDKLMSSEISILELILKSNTDNQSYPKLSIMNNEDNQNLKKYKDTKINILNFINNLKYLFNVNFKKIDFLSIKCFEVDYFKKKKSKYSDLFFNYKLELKNKGEKFILFKSLFENLSKNSQYLKLLKYKEYDFYEIFKKLIFLVTSDFEMMLDEFEKKKNNIKKIKPKMIIFGSSNPFYLPNILFRKIAKDLDIPYTIWVHGGNGGTKSLIGNDVLDFRFSINHFSYGEHLREYMNNEKYGLNRIKSFYWKDKIKIFAIGSPKMDYQYKLFKKDNIENKKKKIIFLTGSVVKRNHYYFGNLRKDTKNSFWRLNINIINLLKKFQDKYSITIKDYPDGQKNLWSQILRDTNIKNAQYISEEKTVPEVLSEADLIILPWFSTTFFESLYTNSDIFLLEKEIIDEFLSNKFTKEIFFYRDEELFLNNLNKYLEQGIFNRKEKKFTKEYFLNISNIENRDVEIKKALNQII